MDAQERIASKQIHFVMLRSFLSASSSVEPTRNAEDYHLTPDGLQVKNQPINGQGNHPFDPRGSGLVTGFILDSQTYLMDACLDNLSNIPREISVTIEIPAWD